MADRVAKVWTAISVTGIRSSGLPDRSVPAAMTRRENARGFTLIEILVVVIIIATVSSIALLSMNLIGDDRDLNTERKRLATILEVAQDEAVMQGREFGLELLRTGYRFVEFDPLQSQWSEIPGDELFRLRKLPEGIELELYVEDKRILLEDDPKQFKQADDETMQIGIDDYTPHLLLFSSGEMTAYEIRVRRYDSGQELVMRGDILGEIEFVETGE